MNTPSEGAKILGIRRVGSHGFGTAVAIRVEHEGRVRTLILGRDDAIEGFGRAGARAIRDAIEQYEDVWSALDLEGRMRLLWQEANEHLAHRTERTEDAILAAVPEVRRARDTEPPQAALDGRPDAPPEAGQHPILDLDDGDPAPQLGVGTGQLDADVAATHQDEFVGKVLAEEELGGADDAIAVQGQVGQFDGP